VDYIFARAHQSVPTERANFGIETLAQSAAILTI
jgi:hypothetical protein